MNKSINKDGFLRYLWDNFSVSPGFYRMVANVLNYAEGLKEEEQLPFLLFVLDGTCGLEKAEIKEYAFGTKGGNENGE